MDGKVLGIQPHSTHGLIFTNVDRLYLSKIINEAQYLNQAIITLNKTHKANISYHDIKGNKLKSNIHQIYQVKSNILNRNKSILIKSEKSTKH